jgi:hypothetical protein
VEQPDGPACPVGDAVDAGEHDRPRGSPAPHELDDLALVRRAVHGELRRLPRARRELRARDVGAGRQPGRLQRDQPARHGTVDIVQDALDALVRVDRPRQEGEIRRDVREALRVNAPMDAEALDPSQQRREADLPGRQPLHQHVAREPRAVGDRLAEEHRQLERVGDHESTPPTSHPRPVVARPPAIEPSR